MENTLGHLFQTVPDHRVTGRCTYALTDLLTIALLTYLCGGEDYVDMSEFAHVRARDFGLLSYTDLSPSPDTFERLMSAVDPGEIERCLVDYGRQFLETLAEKQVAIDGKKLRGAAPKASGTQGDYLMNAFVSENHISLGQLRLQGKENEISAIPRFLEKLDLEGAVVSMDAIGTQVGIAQGIREKKAHYFLAVKENQEPCTSRSWRPSGTTGPWTRPPRWTRATGASRPATAASWTPPPSRTGRCADGGPA